MFVVVMIITITYQIITIHVFGIIEIIIKSNDNYVPPCVMIIIIIQIIIQVLKCLITTSDHA